MFQCKKTQVVLSNLIRFAMPPPGMGYTFRARAGSAFNRVSDHPLSKWFNASAAPARIPLKGKTRLSRLLPHACSPDVHTAYDADATFNRDAVAADAPNPDTNPPPPKYDPSPAAAAD